MKQLIDEPWGKLSLDETNKRLYMAVHHSNQKQVEQLHERAVEAVKQQQADTMLVDVHDRAESTDQNIDNSVMNIRTALKNGLKRLAIFRSGSNKHEQELTDRFISEMGSEQIRYFDNKQEAEDFLNGARGSKKAA